MSDRTPGEEAFQKLSEEEQARILSLGDAIGAWVTSHVVQILIGQPGAVLDAPRAQHASGVWVAFESGPVLFTAQHVLEGYRKLASTAKVVFQVGNTNFDPEERVLFESVRGDIAALRLDEGELLEIPARGWAPLAWPPTIPGEGELAGFAGFPTEYRIDAGPGKIDLAAVGGHLVVDVIGPGIFGCTVRRDSIIHTRGPGVPPQGANLKGMSGGPVFRLNSPDRPPELVGIISRDNPAYDLLWFAPLGNIADLEDDPLGPEAGRGRALAAMKPDLRPGSTIGGAERMSLIVPDEVIASLAASQSELDLILETVARVHGQYPEWPAFRTLRVASHLLFSWAQRQPGIEEVS